MNEKLRFYQGFETSSERPIVILFFYYYYFFSFSGHMLVEHSEETVGNSKKVLLYIATKQQCHEYQKLSTSGSGTSCFQKTIHVFPIRSQNFFVSNQNAMKLCTQIVDTQTYMLHYERKLPALTVFELLSFKLYKKGGCFQKSTKSPKVFFCLYDIKDNSKLNIHAKFQIDIGSTSGSMTS